MSAWQAEIMSWGMVDPIEVSDRATRVQMLAFLDEFCRGKTLCDAREWYAQAFVDTDHPVDTAS
jgi:hypothetical protein